MGRTGQPRDRRAARRAAMSNGRIVRLVLAHCTAVVAEWDSVIGVLVLVFDARGDRAAGAASIALLVAELVAAPFAGALIDRLRPQRARLLGLTVQAAGYATAAVAALADAPLAAVIGAMVALGAATTLRPSGAILIPAHARTSDELIVANVWVWYAEGLSVLGGPLLATALLGAGGPGAVLIGCAASTFIGAAVSTLDLGADPRPLAASEPVDEARPRRIASAWRALRGRPGLTSVLVVVWVEYVMIGALDLLLVVLASDELGLGDTGPGVLSAVFGVGAVVALASGTKLVGRPRLAPVLAVALGLVALGFGGLAAALTLPVALVALPALGACRSLFDGASRLLLQRSADPDMLGSVFTIRELCGSAGLISGSVLVLALLSAGDSRSVLIGLTAVFGLALVLTLRGLRVADDSADVPVVEMSVLRRVPIFAPLPAVTLEAVAKTASTVTVDAGATVVRQGDDGDLFYVVVDGSFDVHMSGAFIRSLHRLDSFGEVALLASVPRTATVTATSAATLLTIERDEFLGAVTSTDSARRATWGVVRSLTLEDDVAPSRAQLALGFEPEG